MNRIIPFVLLAWGIVSISNCKNDKSTPAPASSRTYRMGFQSSAPRPDLNLYLQSLAIWTQRADAAMITTEVPWDSLFNGESIQKFVSYNYVGVVDYYRQANLELYIFIDPANGLDRSADSNELVALGKSIADADAQKLYRRFVVVMDSMLRPGHLGLALETNLLRVAAPASIYNGVKAAASAAVADVRAVDKNVQLSISIQADVAWGKTLTTAATNFIGVDQDLTDFSFVEELGISSYPYFNFSSPADLPVDYYSKLVAGRSLPVFVSEGGYTSQTFTADNNQVIKSSEQLQADYIVKQGQILDDAKATAVFQLAFTDIDLSAVPSTVDHDIAYFAYIGLVDINLNAKPSLDKWDELFKRKKN